MSEQEYLYIGTYNHVNIKSLPNDCKLGVTKDIDNRRYQLNRTKSPITYKMEKVWTIPSTLHREKIEKLIHDRFENDKYDGCEWFDIELNVFYNKLSKLLQIYNETFLSNNEEKFEEIIMNNNEDCEMNEDYENKKKAKPGKLKLTTIEGETIFESTSRDTFIKCLHYYGTKFGIEEIATCLDFVDDENDINSLYKNAIFKFGNFYYHTNTNTRQKYSILKRIIDKYETNDNLELL